MTTREFTAIIGDGATTAILVTHGKHTKTGHVAVRDVASGRQLDPTEYEIVFPGPDTLVLTFATPPALNAFEVTFTAAVPTEIATPAPPPIDAPALALLARGIGFITAQFGATAFLLQQPGRQSMIGAFSGHWNDLGRHEEVTINGKRVFFSVLVECPRAQFTVLPVEGLIVIRSSDGFTGRIVGRVEADDLTVRFPVDTRHK